MGYPVDDRYGLVLQFAEFSLLPALLARTPESPAGEVPNAWTELLSETGTNTDHVDDEEVDEGPSAMAADAWRLSFGLELVARDGLTDPGRRVAELAEEPVMDSAFQEQLRGVLAQQIEAHYFDRETSLTGALQAAAQRLATSELREYLPGLLLIELRSLIQWAHSGRPPADEWLDRLVEYRTAAVDTYGLPDVDLTRLAELQGEEEARRFWQQTGFADAIARYHLVQLDSTGMTVTEARCTAMLLTYAGFLEECHLVGPVQCLVVPAGR